MKKKTSILIEEKVWTRFLHFVLTKYGTTRKASEEVEKALNEYLAKHERD